jgi:hypothetical protein
MCDDIPVVSDHHMYCLRLNKHNYRAITFSSHRCLIAQSLDWHWLFWFMLILSCAFAVPFFLFLPETGRKVVDDGSIPPASLSWNVINHRRHARRRERGIHLDAAKVSELRQNYRFEVPNPLPTLNIIVDLELFVVCSSLEPASHASAQSPRELRRRSAIFTTSRTFKSH